MHGEYLSPRADDRIYVQLVASHLFLTEDLYFRFIGFKHLLIHLKILSLICIFFFVCRIFSLRNANSKNLCLKTTMWSILPHCTVSKNQAERGFWDSIKKVKLWRGTEWRKPSPRHILYQNLLKVWNELLFFFRPLSVCLCQLYPWCPHSVEFA